MAQNKTAPCCKQEAAVLSNGVDASDNTANNTKTQAIIDGWWLATELHRDLALRVVNTFKTDQTAAIALRKDLAE